jgi:hypothetical protein
MRWRARIGHLRAIKAAEDGDEMIEARRAFRAARLADRIRETLDEEPELTTKQRRELARMLT